MNRFYNNQSSFDHFWVVFYGKWKNKTKKKNLNFINSFKMEALHGIFIIMLFENTRYTHTHTHAYRAFSRGHHKTGRRFISRMTTRLSTTFKEM